MKDWIGNQKSIYTTIGASNHTEKERETNDYYATDPKAIDYLLEKAIIPKDIPIWECAAGEGHLSKRLIELGYKVYSTDLIDRGFSGGGTDFLESHEHWNGYILTNPPYKYALEFVEHALELIPDGNRVFMFLKLTFLEGQKRRKLFDTKQLKTVYVSSKRIKCGLNGDFDSLGSSAIAYTWMEFQKGYNGQPTIEWIN